MAELYYTNISDRQARLIFAYAEARVLNITPSMSRYILALSRAGRGYATDPHEEEFRKHVVKAVDTLMRSKREIVGTRNLPEKKTMDAVAEDLTSAFRNLCSFKTSRYLEKVDEEIEAEDEEK